MIHSIKSLLKAGALGALAITAPLMAAAEGFPDRPMSLIFFFPSGGSGDAQARAAAHGLSQILGGNMVVRNVEGGAGTVGLVGMMHDAPDGYTLGFLPEGLATVQPMRNPLPYTFESFDHICKLTFMPVALFGSSAAPYHNLQELAAYAQDHDIVYGHPGVGTVPHLAMEAFMQAAGIHARSVPFNGDGPGTAALRGGHIDLYVAGSPATNVLSGDDTQVLGVFGNQRLANVPDVATAPEQGYDVTAGVAFGISGPHGIDPQVRQTLTDACHTLSESPEFIESVHNLTAVVDYADGQGFEDYLRQREAVYRELLTSIGLIGG
ncbi:MAG: tripartite tricarboxylate transporter substrate binding protein [Rhodobacter sp.]|nr:tripartite tricarboxylate transporter substrate binding protein [Rhodobacter sp.]